jgi:hypothetical protein
VTADGNRVTFDSILAASRACKIAHSRIAALIRTGKPDENGRRYVRVVPLPKKPRASPRVLVGLKLLGAPTVTLADQFGLSMKRIGEILAMHGTGAHYAKGGMIPDASYRITADKHKALALPASVPLEADRISSFSRRLLAIALELLSR